MANHDTKGTKVFIGNLAPECDGRDLRDFFRDYGVINDAWVARKPPGFGFVWLDDERDARDAVRDLDGRDCRGKRVRIELSSGRGPSGGGGGGGGGGYGGGGGDRRDDRGGGGGGGRGYDTPQLLNRRPYVGARAREQTLEPKHGSPAPPL
ncbi:hypothetical protein T484DRAFT_1669109 [Baffinella frigidus]|nr:hypothetical protein T484DRAFT_1669109 [Cryptophyta sp. CCMP2293]